MSFLTADERAALEAVLPGWLPQQRWFAGEHPASVVVVADAALTPTVGLTVVEANGVRYVVPLARTIAHPPLAAGLADATHGTSFWAVVRDVLRGEVHPLLRARHPAMPRHLSDAVAPLRLDHSNAAAVLGARGYDQAFVKMYRRAEPVPSLEATTLTFLSEARTYKHAVPVYGVVEATLPGLAPLTLAVAMHALHRPDNTAWKRTVAQARDLFEGRAPRPSVLPTATPDSLLRDAAFAGLLTARMHDTLHALGTEPFGAADILRRIEVVRENARTSKLPAAWIDRINASTSSGFRYGHRQRLHGDFHLGQILREGHRTVVIDFEGEPMRPPEQRGIPDHPYRDLAGLLRSYDYATAVATQGLNVPDGVRQMLTHTLQAKAFRAYRNRALLRRSRPAGYPPKRKGGTFLPMDGAHPALLRVFVIEKALYEIQYERAYRPDWAWIPEQALERLLGDNASTSTLSESEP